MTDATQEGASAPQQSAGTSADISPENYGGFGGPGEDGPTLVDRVSAALSELRLMNEVADDTALRYNLGGVELVTRCYDIAPNLIRTFGQWRLGETVNEPAVLVQAANTVNLGMTGVKAALTDETVFLAAEHIVRADDDVRGLLALSFASLGMAIQAFHGIVVDQGDISSAEWDTRTDDDAPGADASGAAAPEADAAQDAPASEPDQQTS